MQNGSQAADVRPFRYCFGTAEFDPQRLELRVDGELVDVQRKPLEILAQLLANAGSIVTRERLLENIWGGRPIVDNVIASAITKLRNALGSRNASFLVTHPRVGYRWCGDVVRLESARETNLDDLRTGAPLPCRPNFVLMKQLEGSNQNEVWTAQHIHTGEVRVYKFSRTSEGLASLRRETALLHMLHKDVGSRPDIAFVVDWHLDAPPYFVAYEFGGVNLAAWAEAHGALRNTTRQERLDIFTGVANAVAAAHRGGVVHQDLKPSNILITASDEGGWHVRLTDFGSGHLMQSERLARMRITQFGLVSADSLTAGSSSATPIYVAPELLAGHPATEQSDIYALGILLYQLLVGDLRRPLASGWERNIDDELLREDIARATDCDPQRRFSRVTDFCEHLCSVVERRAVRDMQIRDARAAALAREAQLCRRSSRGWMIATYTLGAIALLQGAVIIQDWFTSR